MSIYAEPTDGRAVPQRPARDRSDDDAVLAGLRRGDRPVLVRGGTVLSQDPAVGDLRGDVLVRDGRIAAVGPDLAAPDAVVLDASDAIVLPGFVDSHVHAWEGQLRGIAPAVDFGGYLGITAFGHGPRYTPHDTYLGTLVTALVALDAGITTIVDNAHNCRGYAHAAAGVEALTDSGVRGVHAWGRPFGSEPGDWLAEVTRLREEYFRTDGRVTSRLCDIVPSADMWDYARAEGLWMSHEMGTHVPDVGDTIDALAGKGLLTDRHAFNHCYDLPDRTWAQIRDAGAAVNLCPRSDAAFGLGSSVPPVDDARRHGIVPGLSGDNEISYGLSMFTEMRVLLNGHRGRTFAAAHAGAAAPEQLSPAEVLSWATTGGARNAGLSDRIGSITPGKEADLVLVTTSDPNTAAIDPVGVVTAFAHAGNVDTVLVGGEVRKFRGRAVGTDADRLRALVAASRERLTGGSEEGGA